MLSLRDTLMAEEAEACDLRGENAPKRPKGRPYRPVSVVDLMPPVDKPTEIVFDGPEALAKAVVERVQRADGKWVLRVLDGEAIAASDEGACIIQIPSEGVEVTELLSLMSECNEGREIFTDSDGRVFIGRPTAIQFALELSRRKVVEAIAAERAKPTVSDLLSMSFMISSSRYS